MMAKLSNPFAFKRGPVTIFTTLIYLAVLIPLIIVHTSVPSAPTANSPYNGVNLTEAWLDLQLLTSSYHPYNSRANDYVHDWLLFRIESIIAENKATDSAQAYVFNDTTSNLIYASKGSTTPSSSGGISVYFEGTNIIVYVRGEEDDQSEWWKNSKGKPSSRNAILVNAHYDSVSTGFGATDDGMGVITVLQLVKYFTTAGNQPKHGVVLLLNNGEEDFLNGASVFSQHPMSKVVSAFLNLEGAAAGGRASLFRSTDYDVTKAYGKSPYPFGTVISGDGFQSGLVRSQTDYVIFNGNLGLRGLDVAFIEPRARYHTNQDDSRHASRDSLWHMLSAAVATTKSLTSKTLETNADPNNVPGSAAVWFDIFGITFAVLEAHTLFAFSVTLLIAGPLFLLVTLGFLYKADKLYMWSGSKEYLLPEGEDTIALYGWRGFFRYPLIFLLSCAAPVALAYLLFKENEFIVHSSEWAVWSMMISSFIFVAWFCSRVADFARPSALTRAYGYSWMSVAWWAFLVAGTVYEEKLHLAGTYFIFFYTLSTFVATFLAYLELFSLPKKSKYCHGKFGEEHPTSRSASGNRLEGGASSTGREHNTEESHQEEEDEEEATERSGLLGNRGRSIYKKYTQQEDNTTDTASKLHDKLERDEPDWSKPLWSSMWVLQIVILVPINLILTGQIALLLVSALHQTGPDGSSVFLVYISMATFTIILFSPIVPILHRFTWHIPIFLLLVLIGTLFYNLLAFPFSSQNRLKLYFQQEIDLYSGINNVSFLGVTPYVYDAASTLPSSAGQKVACVPSNGRQKCSWNGLAPNVIGSATNLPPEAQYWSWLNFNATKLPAGNEASFVVTGNNTRACKLVFNTTVADFKIDGKDLEDPRFPPISEVRSKEIRLWSRTWDRTWKVDVRFNIQDDNLGIGGKVVCLWSDVNQQGVIPAYDEALHYVPTWVAMSKAADGLVEGYKSFAI